MNSVGIDLHRNRSHIAVIDEHGELSVSRRIVNDRDTFLEVLGALEGDSMIAVEASTLAHLLRADLLPEAYIAPRELRDLRELLRHRAALTAMRAALKNRIHAILAKHGITRQHSDLFGKGGRQFLAELRLREAPRRRLDSLNALID